ncbi:hypothetical protein ISS37_07675 [candidate division KSB1 bacterium]|nr:hypothetical protein [candidate division KSB1 bacterium]
MLFTPSKITSLNSNEQGKVRIVLNRNILNKKSFFKSVNPDNKIYFWFTGSGDRSSKKPPNIVELQFKKLLRNKEALVFYDEEYAELASLVLDCLLRQHTVIRELTGSDPPLWGVVLSNLNEPIHFYEPVFFENGDEYHLWAFSVSDTELSDILLVNIHEWTEHLIFLSLSTKDKNIRWFQDGLSELSKLEFAKSLSPAQRDSLSIRSRLKNNFSGYSQYIRKKLKKGDEEIVFDLTQWGLPSLRKVYSDADLFGYPLSQYFWIDLSNKYGKKKIAEFFTEAVKIENATNEDYISLLSKTVGEDIRERLSHFNLNEVLETLESESKTLDISEFLEEIPAL